MATCTKILVALGGLLGGWLGAAAPAAGQCHAGFVSHGVAHHTPGPADTVVTTERNNRLGFRAGPVLVRNGQGTLLGGLAMDVTGFVGPRVQVGGGFTVTAYSAAPTNFGTDATAPALTLLTLGPSLRYVVANGRRWRLEMLANPGLNWYRLGDRDHMVAVRNSCGCSSSAPALVAQSVRPLLETGLGLTYKLSRKLWLSSDLRYGQVLGGAPFGEAALQSQWQWVVAVAIPAGFVRRSAAARP